MNPGYGQFKNILLDSMADKQGRYPVEPTIAINYKTPDNIVVAAFPDHVYASNDGGLSWTKSKSRAAFGVWDNPVLVSDFSGSMYYIHHANPEGKNKPGSERLDRIVIKKSKDGGTTWDDGNSLGFNPPKDQYNPGAITDRKGNVFVAWTQMDKYGNTDEGCKAQVLFSKSSGGSKWSKPVVISKAGGCNDNDITPRGAVPAISGEGRLFVAWTYDGVIYIDRSFDGGNTWLSSDIAVTEQAGGSSFSVPGIQKVMGLPTLVCDNSKSLFNGALYMVWSEESMAEDTDIYFMRSLNFGDNWTQPLRINDDDPGSYQFMPAMAVDHVSGFIYIVYYDRRDHEDNQTDVYLAYSIDNGASFKNVKISDKPFLPSADVPFGKKISIAANNGIIIPVWTRMDNGKTSIWASIIRHEDLAGFKPEPKTGKKKKK
ncbi:MAG: exo-alpha-sialidase [Cyclobacteriaceae bacterium]|nr:exo-alpha-sialidase [Cyclobacteriaceae bacterium]UYN88514.1 MAG: exo-alpha-sialidase [Cyclobacteriaceae bacterium]